MLLTSLSNAGVVDLEVCCPIFGTLHSAPRYFNITDRSEFSLGPVPHSMMLEMLKIFWNGYHRLLRGIVDVCIAPVMDTDWRLLQHVRFELS